MNKSIVITNQLISIKPVSPLHQDENGWIVNATGESSNKDQTTLLQPRIISTKTNIIRGNHYHPDETEIIIFLNGNWSANFSDQAKTDIQKIDLDCTQSPVCVTIPPKIAHAFRYKGEDIGYIFHYANKPYKINRAKTLKLI